MDIARDLVDRQLVDPDERACGRVDDLWIEWDDDGARLGPVASGPAIMLDQLGVTGRLLQRAGGAYARRSRTIGWAGVARVLRTHVQLVRDPHTEAPSPGARRYSAIARLPVIDSDGERRGVLDLRSENSPGGTAPAILGLIVCRRTWLRALGMKRYDAASVPLAEVESHARFVPWEAVAGVDDAIRLRSAFADLPRLKDAPDPGPPPKGES